MFRKSIIFISIAATFLLLLSCNDKKTKTPDEEKEITLVMAEVNPPETIAGRMDQAFKEKVEELSGGKIKIDLQCSGILGDNTSVRNIITKPHSTIQIARQGPITALHKSYGLFLIPYTFSNREHFWRFANSETAQKLLEKPRESGMNIIGLFYGEEGFRHLFSTKKISGIADFEGLTMRVPNDKSSIALAESLKMKQKQVNFADLYSALIKGDVDVADQPLANYLANHFDEVAPNIILDSHQIGAMETFITTECWDSLSENQQRILREAGKYASEYCRKISEEEEENILKQLAEKGVSVTKVDDITPWQEALSDFIKESAADDMELYQEILSYAKE